MKKLIALCTAAVVTLTLAAPMQAADAKKPTAEKSAKASKTKKKRDSFPYYGNIGAIDSKAMTFTIVGKSSTRTFHVTKASKLLRDDKPADLSAFKPGERVAGSCKHATDKGKGHYTIMSMRPRPAKKKK